MNDRDLQQKRITAAMIDIGITIAICLALGIMVGVLSFFGSSSTVGEYFTRFLWFVLSAVLLAYVLGRDIVAGDRSIGKKLQEIRVVNTSGAPIDFMVSARRNGIFAIGFALFFVSATLHLIPYVGGILACLFTPLVGLGVVLSVGAAIYEMLQITQQPEGIRFGDRTAGTRVIK
jgi:RDD family protein